MTEKRDEYKAEVLSVEDDRCEIKIQDRSGVWHTMMIDREVLYDVEADFVGADLVFCFSKGQRSIDVLNPEKRPKRKKLKPLPFKKTMKELRKFFLASMSPEERKRFILPNFWLDPEGEKGQIILEKLKSSGLEEREDYVVTLDPGIEKEPLEEYPGPVVFTNTEDEDISKRAYTGIPAVIEYIDSLIIKRQEGMTAS